MNAANPVSWSILFMFLSGLGLPLGVPPLPETQLLSKIAPEECLFYKSSSGMAAPDAKSGNQTEQLLAEPEVQKKFGELEKLIRTKLSQSIRQSDLPPGMSSDELVDMVKLLLTRPMAIYISDIQISPIGPNIRAGAAIKIGDGAEKLKSRFDELLKTLPPQMLETKEIDGDKFHTIIIPTGDKFVWGFKKNFFVLATGDGEIEALLKRASGDPPKWLAKIRQELPVERVSTVGYLNVKSLLKIVLPLAGPQAATVLDTLGISNIDHISSTTGLDKENYISKTLISLNGEPQGIMQFASIEPLSSDDLASVPVDATTALAVKINPAGVFDAYMAMAEKIDPQGTAYIRRNMERAESELELKIRQDLLASFGDTAIVYGKFAQVPDIVVALKVKDYQQALKTQEKLVQKYQAVFEQAPKTNPSVPKLIKDKIEGKESYYLTLPPPQAFSIYWCLTEKELVISPMGYECVKSYLSRSADFKSLAQSPEAAKLFTGESAPTTVLYLNVPQIFKQYYPLLPMLGASLQQEGINLDFSKLPQETIGAHLTPLVSAVRRTKSGIEIIERSPLPGLGVAQAPIAAAWLLPAVHSARGAATRAASINNMKQIMLAMHNYHDANKHFPPAYKADKEGKPLLSWRVLILPMMEYGNLYNQFHLDEPWDSEHNKKLIDKMPPEYRSPDSRAGAGKTNYLTVRGENTVFAGKDGVKISDITDGTAFTIALVEASDDKAVIWTKPDDFEIDNNNPKKGLIGLQPNVFLAGFADGSVRALSSTIDAEVIKGLFSRNGGEPVQGKY
jgi:hypothetical protein